MGTNRWTTVIGFAGLSFGLVAIAAPALTTQTIALSLPQQAQAATVSTPANGPILASAATTSVMPSSNQVSSTVEPSASTQSETPPPSHSPAGTTTLETNIHDIPLPPEFTPETAASAVSPASVGSSVAPLPESSGAGKTADQAKVTPSSKALASPTSKAPKSTTPAIQPKTSAPPTTATIPATNTTETTPLPTSKPTVNVLPPAEVRTGQAPGSEPIAPVSSTPIAPIKEAPKPTSSLPLLDNTTTPVSKATLTPNNDNALLSPTNTAVSSATPVDTTDTAAVGGAVIAVPASASTGLLPGTTVPVVSKKAIDAIKTNAVSAQELAWRIDQPNPSAGSSSIPLMLSNPDPGRTNISAAIRQTLETHPQILQNFAEQLAAQEDIEQAKGGLLPSLDVNAGIGPENSNNPGTRAAGLGDINLTRKESQALMQQLLFDGGNVTNTIRQASANYEVSAYQLAQAKELLSFDAADAYLSVLRQRQLVEVYTYDAQAHAILLSKIVRRFQAGAGTKSDVELAQGRLAQAQAQVTQSEGDLATANDTYMKIVGVYPTVNMQKPLVPLHLPGSLVQAQTLGMAMSPNIQGSLAQVAAAQAAVGVAKSNFYPTVTLNLTKHYDDNLAGVPGADQESSAMVRANYNVFKGGSDRAAVAAANYRVTAAIDQARVTQRDVGFAIAQAWNTLLSKLDQIRNLTIHEKQSYNVWQAYIKQFQLGQRTLWDMLNAQSEYYDAQVAVVNGTYDAMSARYQLLASIGALAGTIMDPEQNVFARRPLTPPIMPGEVHAQTVPQIGSNVPAPTVHLPNIN